MDDDTHARPIRPPVSGSVAHELAMLVRDSRSMHSGRRVDSLGAAGDRLIAQASPWSEQVLELLADFEVALEPHHLSDEGNRAMKFAAGIDRLYGLLDDLSRIAEPNP